MTKTTKTTRTRKLQVSILAIDPGDTTGWVRVLLDPYAPHSHIERWGHFYGLHDEIDAIEIMYKGADIVVAESYVIRPDTARANIGSSLAAVEVLGQVKMICAMRHLEPLILQTASQAKQQWTDRRLKMHFPDHDLAPTGSPGVRKDRLCEHECDALRHACTLAENLYGIELVLTDPEHVV